MSKITSLLAEKITPVVEELGYELVDVEYKKEGKNWYLRVFIDKLNGITLDDCQTVSRRLDELLDEWDIIQNAYFLEVSSPGLERPLKKPTDYQRFTGKKVKIKTNETIFDRKNFVGEIMGIDDGVVIIQVEGQEQHIPFNKISSAKLVF